MSIAIAFAYTDYALVQAALREFRVYPVDDNHARLAAAIVVAPGAIPTDADPLTVPMPPTATRVEVVPVDVDGQEGMAAYT